MAGYFMWYSGYFIYMAIINKPSYIWLDVTLVTRFFGGSKLITKALWRGYPLAGISRGRPRPFPLGTPRPRNFRMRRAMYICFMLFFNYGYPGARCMFWGGRNAGRALTCYALQLVQTASWQQGVCVFSTLTWRSCKWLPTYCLLWRRSGDWARGCWLGDWGICP